MNVRRVYASLAIVALTLAVFGQVHRHEFVDWDDTFVITQNPAFAFGSSGVELGRAVVAPHAANWVPLSQLSLLVTRALAGPGPAGFLLGNLVIHAAAAVVLFLALARMTGARGRSAFVAAVFAVHPLHVESVAWASERDDVMAGLFFAVTLFAYARYAEQRQSWERYAHVLIAFACALFSKPTVVTLPFVLLLLDYWPLGRLRRGDWAGLRPLLLEKLPMFALVAVVAGITYLVQRGEGAMEYAAEVLPLRLRLWNALDSYGMYLAKAIFPSELSVHYPHPLEAVPRGRALLAGFALVSLSVAAWRLRGRSPYLLVGWLWYLGMLVPMIGFVQVGFQARADRYMYLPLIGLAIAFAWGLVELVGASRARRRALAVAGVVVVALLALAAHRQTGYWRDSVTLFSRAVELDPSNLVVQHRLAVAYGAAGDYDAAQQHYERTIRLEPRWALARLELGHLLERQEKLPEAVARYVEGLELDPRHIAGQASLGRVLLRLGRVEEARLALERAQALGADAGELHALLATAAQLSGRDAEAVRFNREALAREPRLLSAANNLAWSLATSSDVSVRDPEEAVRVAELAVARLEKPDPGFLDTLAVSYAAAGRFQEAVETATRAAALAREQDDAAAADEISARIPLFRARRAWTPPAPPGAAR